MELEVSLSCSQESATGPWSGTNEFNPHPPCLPTIHFNIILPSTPRSSEWTLCAMLSNQNLVRTSNFPMRATRTTHLTSLT
jgi:hypothetical protein